MPRQRKSRRKLSSQSHAAARAAALDIASLMDPFSSDRIVYHPSPGDFGEHVVQFTIERVVAVSTNANGERAFIFRPLCGQDDYGQPPITGSTYSMTYNLHSSGVSAFSGDSIEHIRTLSGGVQWLPTQAMDGDAAIFSIKSIDAASGATHVLSSGTGCDDQMMTTSRTPWVAVANPSLGVDEWYDADYDWGTNSDGLDYPFDSISIEILGPVSTTFGYIRMVTKCEGVFRHPLADFKRLIKQPAPRVDPHRKTLLDNARHKHKALHPNQEAHEDTLLETIEKEALSVLKTGVSFAGGLAARGVTDYFTENDTLGKVAQSGTTMYIDGLFSKEDKTQYHRIN